MSNTYLPRAVDSGERAIGFFRFCASGEKAGTGKSMRGSSPPSGMVPAGGSNGRVASRAWTAACSFICGNHFGATCSKQPAPVSTAAAHSQRDSARARRTSAFNDPDLLAAGGVQQLLHALDLVGATAHQAAELIAAEARAVGAPVARPEQQA